MVRIFHRRRSPFDRKRFDLPREQPIWDLRCGEGDGNTSRRGCRLLNTQAGMPFNLPVRPPKAVFPFFDMALRL